MTARVARCLSVRCSGLRHTAHRAPLSVTAASVRLPVPPPRAAFHTCRRTLSNAPVAQAIRWYGSRQRIACGARLPTTSPIHSAASADTWVALPGPLAAQGVEECRDRGLVPTGAGPHQPAGVVIEYHGQIPLPLAVCHLVDPDAAQPGQPVNLTDPPWRRHCAIGR